MIVLLKKNFQALQDIMNSLYKCVCLTTFAIIFLAQFGSILLGGCNFKILKTKNQTKKKPHLVLIAVLHLVYCRLKGKKPNRVQVSHCVSNAHM